MNHAKWEDVHIPLPVLALKLCEEAAEVGTEITDAVMVANDTGLLPYPDRDKIREECDHVIFIAMQIKRRMGVT